MDVENLNNVWTLPGIEDQYPHEVAIGPAPLALSGAGERLHAVYVVPTCPPAQCGKMRRFVALPQGHRLPSGEAIAAAGPQPLPRMPQLPSQSAAPAPMQTGGKGGQAAQTPGAQVQVPAQSGSGGDAASQQQQQEEEAEVQGTAQEVEQELEQEEEEEAEGE